MNSNWNYICKTLLECKIKKVNEYEYQNNIDSIFRLYLRWLDNIHKEESLQIGSVGFIRPDFVLYKNNTPVLILESKEPNHIQVEKDKQQLFSYMRQKKVDFGLYIGENIQLYYDIPNDNEAPVIILTLEYELESNMGDELFSILYYDNFDLSHLRIFCEDLLTKKKRKDTIDQEIQRFEKTDSLELYNNFIKKHFQSKGYKESEIDYITNQFEFTIKLKNKIQEKSVVSKNNAVIIESPLVPTDKTLKKRPKYSINGKGEYWKNGVALELVKLYMTDNPSTYQRLNNIFNGKINHYLITKDDADKEILLSNDSRKEQRWHIKTPLKSCDNVIFYVTTQVGVNCQIDFNDIVDLAGELGYTIKEV